MTGYTMEWPARGWAAAIAGALTGLAVHFLTDGADGDALRLALAAALVVAGVTMVFVVERRRIRPAALFAGCSALVVGFAIYWNGAPFRNDSWEEWRLAWALLTVAIAAPLFQAWSDAGMPRPPRLALLAYPQVHDRAWTNVVLWFASWAFTAVTWLLAWLLAALFDLIGIDVLIELLKESWFAMMLTGGAFGAAAGLLRDRERILGTLQTIVRKVLSVLTPVLGAGLALFLVAMLFTGLDPLWEATKQTTPILVGTVIAALILANAAIGDTPEDEATAALLRWGSLALTLAMLPLAIIAAISTGLRIGQYGLTPDRLWAVVFTLVACAYGLAYLVAVALRRASWMAAIRVSNLKLAIGLCGLAFLLSTPLIDFGAWSTRSQLARLESGRVSAKEFDFAALRFDFGPPGKAAVERLAKSGKTPDIREGATLALKAENRWAATTVQEERDAAADLDDRLTIKPAIVPLPGNLRTALVGYDACGQDNKCAIVYHPGDTVVHGARLNCDDCRATVFRLRLIGGKWQSANRYANVAEELQQDDSAADKAALDKGQIEVRDVTSKQVFLGGRPVGDPFAVGAAPER